MNPIVNTELPTLQLDAVTDLAAVSQCCEHIFGTKTDSLHIMNVREFVWGVFVLRMLRREALINAIKVSRSVIIDFLLRYAARDKEWALATCWNTASHSYAVASALC
jgi:hypothetical protein